MRASGMAYAAAVAVLILLAGAMASSRPPAPAPQAAALDPSRLPDIFGVRPGMPAKQAQAIFQKAEDAFNVKLSTEPETYGPGNRMNATYTFLATGGIHGGDMAVDITLPPNPPLVWHVGRYAPQPSVNRSVLIAALRQKYGKESIALGGNAHKPTTDDATITDMFWIMDEQGHPVTSEITFTGGRPFNCELGIGYHGGRSPVNVSDIPEQCAKSFVGLHVGFGMVEIINSMIEDVADYALLARSVKATEDFTKNGNQQIQQQNQQKAKEAKPDI